MMHASRPWPGSVGYASRNPMLNEAVFIPRPSAARQVWGYSAIKLPGHGGPGSIRTTIFPCGASVRARTGDDTVGGCHVSTTLRLHLESTLRVERS